MSFVTRARRAVACAVATLAVAGLTSTVGGVATAAAAPRLDLSTGTHSGVVAKGGVTHARSWAEWRGAPVPVVVDYLGSRSWTSMSNAAWAPQRWPGDEHHVVWSLPMLPYEGTSTLAEGATGAYNQHFRSIAQHLVAGGEGSSTIRLGWEMTGNWFPWSGLKDPASYVGMFRQVVTTMRSVPGADFTFDWNIADQPVDPTPFYPGDAYVDFVGLDLYDWTWSSSFAPTDHEKTWTHHRTRPYGLDWMAAFGKAHGKRLSLPEWGLSQRCDGHGGGDNALLVERLHQWIATHDVAYEAYFDDDDSTCQRFALRTADFPTAAAAYRRLWGSTAPAPAPVVAPSPSTPAPAPAPSSPAPAPSTPAPAPSTPAPAPSTPAPAPSTPAPAPSSPAPAPSTPAPAPVASAPAATLLVSASAARTNPAPVAGATLNGRVHMFAQVGTGVRSVAFSLDGRPVITEFSAPYDFNGTTASGAAALDLRTLSAGSHRATVTVTSTSGAVATTEHRFVVDKTLWVSRLADRSGAQEVAGATLSGSAYVFAQVPTGTRSVAFSVDGRLVRSEGSAPYDLAGTAAAGAAPFDLRTLTPGAHVVRAVVTAADGTTSTVSSTFVRS